MKTNLKRLLAVAKTIFSSSCTRLSVVLLSFLLWTSVGWGQNISVTATSGTTSGSYATLSAAFAAINAGTHQGAITLKVVANTTEPGSPTALLKSASPSNYTSVLITPFGGNYTIGGTITASRAIVELNGADNVTIDGDDPAVAGTRNLTIGFSTTAATIASCIRVSSNSTTGADGANNNTIKNCIITGNRASAGTTATYGINMSNYSTTSLATGGYSSLNNRFENNLITRCYHGIWAVGASATYPNTGLQIVNNILGDGTVAGNIGNRGIIISYTATTEAQAAIVSGNEVVGVGDPGTTGYAASIAGMEFGTVVFGTKIFNNYIHDVKQPSTSGFGAYGVLFSGSTSADSIRFYNNIITRITASNFTTTALSLYTNYGVKMTAGPTFGDFSNNTIVLSTANPTGTTTNPISYALSCEVNGVRIVNFRNNIIVNSVASTNAIGVYTNNNTIFTNNVIWDKNCYWVPSGALGYSAASTPQTTFSAWKAAVGKDGTSYNINPNFVSATDLHINGSTASLLESGGMATTFNTDFDGQARPGPAGSVNGGATSFDIGADEFDGIPITPVSITSTSATANSCTAIAHTVNATVVQGTNAITSVILSYTLNGTAQTPITMTNTSGNTWTATIPAASPTNATIAWTVTATDPVAAPTASGSYQDNALYGIGVTTAATPAAVCLGATSSLSASFYNPTAAPASYTIQAVTYPTTDEDLGNVTITDASTSTVLLNNTSTYNSLVGTLGTATGTAGSFASYITLATVPMTAGSTYNFSLSSLQGVTAYSNAMAIYIDLNRDGDYADAGEAVFNETVLGAGARTISGSFTIPATANNGLTRMRVIVKETSLIGSPTEAIAYGEREEYMVNITSANNGGGGNIPTFTYSWSDGASVLGTTIPYVATVNATSTYTLTAATTVGCSISNSVVVTSYPLPTSPVATNSTQCGSGIPTASISDPNSFTTPTFKWYDASTGGSLLQSSTSSTYVSSISTSTTFYVSVTNPTTGCESARTAVIVTVTQPDAISATTSAASICLGQSVTLTAANTASTPTQSYSYSWLCATAGSGATSANTSNPASITPSAAGSFTYTVTGTDGACNVTNTVAVTVNALPNITSATASPSTVCSGSSITLTGASIPATAGTAILGTGTLNGIGNSGTFVRVGNTVGNQFKTQYLFTAAELQAAGLTTGNITGLSFDVFSSGGGTVSNLTFKLGTTSLTNLTSTYVTGLTQVYTIATYPVSGTLLPGIQSVTFNTPFYWDGVSNLVLEGCSQLATSGSLGDLKTSTTTFVSTIGNSPSTTACSATTGGTTYSIRPNFQFNGQIASNLTSNFNWSWNSTPALSTASGTTSETNTGSSVTTKTYTVTATNATTGCSSTATTNAVTINPATVAPTATNSAHCGSQTPTCSVTGTGTSGNTFAWYTVSTGGTAISGQTASTLSSYPVATTTTLYVSENNGTCQSARTPVTITVSTPPSITAAASVSPLCSGSPTVLTASSANSGYTYSWDNSLGAGASVTANPTTNTTYTVTAIDNSGGANNGCATTATVAVTTNPLPSALSLTPSTTQNICAGNIQSIVAIGGNGATTTATNFVTQDFETSTFNFSAQNGSSATLNTSYYAQGVQSLLFNNTTVSTTKNLTLSSNVDLTNCASASISFSHIAAMEGPTTTYDYGAIEYSSDGGTTWVGFTTSEYVGSASSSVFSGSSVRFSTKSYTDWTSAFTSTTSTPTNSLWKSEQFNIPSAALTNQFKIRFRYTLDGSTNYYGWLIDNFIIVKNLNNITWSPTTELYTDAAATTAYSGTPTTVYSKPTANRTYTATATTSNGCTASASVTLNYSGTPLATAPANNAYVFGATTNTNYNTAANWYTYSNANGYAIASAVPTSSDVVVIPATSTCVKALPSLSATSSITDLEIQSGAVLSLNGNSLSIAGALTGAGTIKGSSTSSLSFTGSASNTLRMDQTTLGTTNVLRNLTLSGTGTTTLGNALNITAGASSGSVTAGSGTTLTTGGFLTLKSDVSGTARIAQSAGTISGNVTQERFVPGKAVRKWSFLASPVTQRLDSAWQQQIHITGPGTGGTMCNNYTISGTMTPHSNGFDVTQLQNPSFYTYDAATDNFVANTSGTNTFTLSPGNGYMVLVRGDRNDATNGGCVLLSANNQAAFTSIPVTLAATGAVGQGTITKVLPTGYSFIGNPYPCELDFPSFNTTNASVISGGYWTYYPTNATYTFSTFNNGTSTNGGTQVIANGQSFLVNSTNGGTITFNEAHKSTTANNGGFRLHTTWDELIRVGLSNNQGNRYDEVVIRFGNDAAITKSINEYDAASVNGGDQWIKTMKDATELAIQTRPNTYQNDTVALAIHAKNAGTYQLGFSEYQGLSNTEVYLIDQQENLIQNVKALPSYDFSVAANTTTANRFKLIFNAKTSGVGSIASNTQLQVYPNPTKDKVSITCNSLEYGAYQVKVRTITGAEVLQAKGFYKNGDVIELSLNDLAVGMYLLELSQDNGFRATQKITKH
jgi:Ig-like domain CHU_C associated/GEVED domain/Secretion system C-terminal sorting domain